MKVLGSAVLTMEIFIMGFAMLIAKDIHEPATLIYGFGFMIAAVITVRLLTKKIGWVLGWILQCALMAYSVVVPAMWIVNLIFMGLWVAAIVVGRKGEAARAALLSQGPPKP